MLLGYGDPWLPLYHDPSQVVSAAESPGPALRGFVDLRDTVLASKTTLHHTLNIRSIGNSQ